jgi:hypothetical protein
VILFTLVVLRPWHLVTADGDGAASRSVSPVSASAELEEARLCVQPGARRRGSGCLRIYERRGGVETRLGKVDAGPIP